MPSTQKVHLDKALSNISIGYKNEAFIADQIFKPVVVDKQSDRYYVFGKEMFRQYDDHRAPGTEANEINWTLSLDTYFCEGHALRHPIPDEEVQNADEGFNLQADATELTTEGILMNKEIDAAAKVMDAANYATGLKVSLGAGGTYKWSDYANSNPILDVKKASEAVHKVSGVRCNTLILPEQVFNILTLHPKLLDIIKYVQRGIVTLDLMKAAFGVDNILVGSALKSSALNPGQNDALSYIWGTSAALCYIAPSPGKRTISLGYSFMWNKDGAGPVQVRQWYEDARRATLVESERWYSQKMVSNVAGYLFAGAVTPLS